MDNKLGDSIKYFRKKIGLTQPELAEILKVSFSTIRRWEVYGGNPRSDEIKKLCEIFHCTESELLNGPSTQNWELRLITTKEEKSMVGTIDLTGKTVNSSLEMSDSGMGLTLSASYDLWADDAKFENLLEQIRHKRAVGLKIRREEW